MRNPRTPQERAWARARYLMRMEVRKGRTLPEYLQIVLRIETGVRVIRNAIALISDNRRYGVKSAAAMLWHAALCVFVEDFYFYIIPTLGCPYPAFDVTGTVSDRAVFNDLVRRVIAYLVEERPLPDITAEAYDRAWETALLLPSDAAADLKEREGRFADVWPLHGRSSSRG